MPSCCPEAQSFPPVPLVTTFASPFLTRSPSPLWRGLSLCLAWSPLIFSLCEHRLWRPRSALPADAPVRALEKPEFIASLTALLAALSADFLVLLIKKPAVSTFPVLSQGLQERSRATFYCRSASKGPFRLHPSVYTEVRSSE